MFKSARRRLSEVLRRSDDGKIELAEEADLVFRGLGFRGLGFRVEGVRV